ncbi:hypothetical protein BDZ97DRAFT_1755206 [Flammula alnicola]|nr:hypothetical protein BDZ97DRAFT_1755206 [Flammula alnicola]
MSIHLLSLAPELIQTIGSILCSDDIKHLRLACKQLSEILESVILDKITFNINKSTLPASISQIRSLAAGRSPGASRTTSHLTLVCFAPRYDPQDESYWDGEMVENPKPLDTPEVLEAERRMKKYLFDAVVSLKNVSTVRWHTHCKDDEWVQNTIMKALRSLPKLQNLSIGLTFLKIALPLQRLQTLREITITDKNCSSGEGPNYETYSNLGKLIARNSFITSIHIERQDYDSQHTDPSASFHHLFWCYPKDAAPLRLRRLVLRRMLIKLDNITLPHLRHLTALDVSSMLEPYEPDPHPSDSDSPFSTESRTEEELLEKQRAVGSNISDIWDTLMVFGIYLEEITLTKITPSFLEYLECYSGLKKLTFTSSGFNNATKSDKCATRFFGTPLTKHVRTLEKLNINAEFEGLWCFGDHNMAVIMQCHALRVLGIRIFGEGLQNKKSPTGAEEENAVVLLIDNVSCYLPFLEHLTISPSTPEMFRGDWCGTSSAAYCSCVQAAIVEQLGTYSAPPACRRLPKVSVNNPWSAEGFTFLPERVNGGSGLEPGEWRYRDTSPHPEKSSSSELQI